VRRLTIAGLIAALTVGSFVLVASAQTGDPAPFWPATTNGPIAVTEWYSDLPWHQKLGTFSGNEIDEALILPYDALPALEKTFCTNNQLTPEACMIETGINNILGTQRTDTPYSTTDPKIMAATECQQSPPCIEVKLELSSFWTRSTGSAITLQQSVWNGTSDTIKSRRLPLLRRVRDHGRHHIRPPDALVYGALLRFTVRTARQRRPGSGLLRRLLFSDEQRVQPLTRAEGNGLAEIGALVGVSICGSPGANQPLPVGR